MHMQLLQLQAGETAIMRGLLLVWKTNCKVTWEANALPSSSYNQNYKLESHAVIMRGLISVWKTNCNVTWEATAQFILQPCTIHWQLPEHSYL